MSKPDAVRVLGIIAIVVICAIIWAWVLYGFWKAFKAT